MKNTKHTSLPWAAFFLAFAVAAAVPMHTVAQDLELLSLEQLLSVEVTSASRKAQKLNDVAAAIFVITAEDIRRSGVSSIPEALRMAPGIHVARIDDTRWAVTSRGFNDQYSNKLLVLMDGRHIYTPYFSGVFWDQHLISVDDIERIEVIRGPGATLWGSNAVNGVINIISRSARDTQGLYLQARIGDQETQSSSVRYGSTTENGWFYRLGFDAIKENVTDSPLDESNNDYWSHTRTGFRIEGSPLPGHQMQVEGYIFKGNSKEIVQSVEPIGDNIFSLARQSEVNTRGGWLMMNWSKESEAGEGWRFQTYFDKSNRDILFADINREAISFEFQSRHYFGESHDVIWGAGARFLDLPFTAKNATFKLVDQNQDWNLFELFAQDEISLSENLSLVLGSKFEHSEYVDWQVQPNVRLNWRLQNDFSVWGAVSRAARTPSFAERQLNIRLNEVSPQIEGVPTGGPTPPFIVSVIGSDSFESELLTAYEAGIRGRLSNSIEFDLSVFSFDYDDVRGGSLLNLVCKPSDVSVFVDPRCLATSAYFDAEFGIGNNITASTAGAELALQWQLATSWHLDAAISLFDFDLQEVETVSPNSYSEPEWLAHVRSQWSLPNNIEIDVAIRGVDSSSTYAIDTNVTADLRFGWKPAAAFNLELIGQNLLNEGYREYGSYSLEALPSMVERRVMLRATWAP